MDKRILLFNKHFERWGIALQPDADQQCPRGTIVSRSWTVKYCFGKDQDGKFLDYYAAHRMTNDRHLRIRDNGDVEGLPAYPDALQRWEPEYIEEFYNRICGHGHHGGVSPEVYEQASF